VFIWSATTIGVLGLLLVGWAIVSRPVEEVTFQGEATTAELIEVPIVAWLGAAFLCLVGGFAVWKYIRSK
jgi:hypothetical protein